MTSVKSHGSFKRVDEHHSFVPGEDKSRGPSLVKSRTKEMRYASLHHHSTFSFLDGFGLPEAHVARAEKIGMSSLAMTEHGNVSSHVKLEQAATKSGIHPIFGCELYTGSVSENNRSQRKNHLTVLSENLEGYRNLLRMVSKSWAEGFYYEPTVSGPMLLDHKEGIIILSGCQGSLLATSLVGGKNIDSSDASYERARSVARSYRREFGDSYYLEVQSFPELDRCREINQAYERLSNELGIPLVATGDVHYTIPTESDMQMILHNVRGGGRKSLEDQAREWSYDVKLAPPTSDRYVYDRLRATGLSRLAALQAIDNSQQIANRCQVELPKLDRLRYPLPSGYKNVREVWIDWLRKGWAYRGIDGKTNRNEYARRFRYEQKIIEDKDFIDYFLVVADLVVFSKDSGIPVGPARGSAAASLVCYLLRITEVDPLEFPNLVFERFIDVTRQDLPDIDLDFDDERRREVREYLVSKYGLESVGNIGTFTSYKAKNSLDDIGRVYKIPVWEIEKVKELLIERSSGDLRSSATIEDTVEYFEQAKDVIDRYPQLRKAMDLEGQYKGLGVHAAGLVVANGPITEVAALYKREVPKKSGNWVDVISPDKYDAEHLNIMKIDVLGLNTMGMIRRVIEAVGITLEDLYALPLDDPEVIDAFHRNDTVGIFQFDGRAMRNLNAELQPDNFKEICDANALARPGPLHSGASSEYIDVKRGRKEAKRIHQMLDKICKDTHYQIVYQEQILRIVREIGNFDWTHAAYIRKIISKKIGEQEFNRQWDRFWAGAQTHGLTYDQARTIWNACITAGSYAFNAAHCVSYGMIAYWTMYLKVHYPHEFYVAALTKYDEKKQLELLQDAVRHGIEVLPPNPNTSDVSWKVFEGKILGGFSQIFGIGEKMAPKIVSVRDEAGKDFWSWDDLSIIKGVGAKKIQTMKDFVASDDPFGIHRLERLIGYAKELIKTGKIKLRYGQLLPYPTHKAEEVPYSKGLDTEVVWIGQVVHRNLRDLFELHFSRTGEVLDPNSVREPSLNEWVVMVGQDETDYVNLTIDRWKYPRFRNAAWSIKLEEDLVLVRGVKKGNQARRAIYVHELWVLESKG